METRTCSSCAKAIQKGSICGRCFAVCKKYYRECSECGANDIPPEKDDDVTHCSKCKPESPGEWKCTKCSNPVDAQWKKTCTPCWFKDNGKKQGTGFCDSCNKKVDDGKPKCIDCWKAAQALVTYNCVTCEKGTGASWKKLCDTCYATNRRARS